jgi:hypothetical protein
VALLPPTWISPDPATDEEYTSYARAEYNQHIALEFGQVEGATEYRVVMRAHLGDSESTFADVVLADWGAYPGPLAVDLWAAIPDNILPLGRVSRVYFAAYARNGIEESPFERSAYVYVVRPDPAVPLLTPEAVTLRDNCALIRNANGQPDSVGAVAEFAHIPAGGQWYSASGMFLGRRRGVSYNQYTEAAGSPQHWYAWLGQWEPGASYSVRMRRLGGDSRGEWGPEAEVTASAPLGSAFRRAVAADHPLAWFRLRPDDPNYGQIWDDVPLHPKDESGWDAQWREPQYPGAVRYTGSVIPSEPEGSAIEVTVAGWGLQPDIPAGSDFVTRPEFALEMAGIFRNANVVLAENTNGVGRWAWVWDTLADGTIRFRLYDHDRIAVLHTLLSSTRMDIYTPHLIAVSVTAGNAYLMVDGVVEDQVATAWDNPWQYAGSLETKPFIRWRPWTPIVADEFISFPSLTPEQHAAHWLAWGAEPVAPPDPVGGIDIVSVGESDALLEALDPPAGAYNLHWQLRLATSADDWSALAAERNGAAVQQPFGGLAGVVHVARVRAEDLGTGRSSQWVQSAPFAPASASADPDTNPPEPDPHEHETFNCERRADFLALFGAESGTSLVRRPDAVSLDYLTAYAPGPVALQNTSQGLVCRPWRMRYETQTNTCMLARSNDAGSGWEEETPLGVLDGVVELDLAFTQNADPVVCAERGGHVWLYWYDPMGGWGWSDFGAGRTPRVILDDPVNVEDSDVQFFYMDDAADAMMRREQRELYAVAHPCPAPDVVHKYIEDVVRAGLRLHVLYSERDVASGRYRIRRLSTHPFPPRLLESADVTATATGGDLWTYVLPVPDVLERADVTATSIGGALEWVLRTLTQPVEAVDVAAAATGGDLSWVLRTLTQPVEAVNVTTTATGGDLRVSTYWITEPVEALNVTATATGGYLG